MGNANGRHLSSKVIHNAERGSTFKLQADGCIESFLRPTAQEASNWQDRVSCQAGWLAPTPFPALRCFPNRFGHSSSYLGTKFIEFQMRFAPIAGLFSSVSFFFSPSPCFSSNWPVPKLATSICIRPFMIHSRKTSARKVLIIFAPFSLPLPHGVTPAARSLKPQQIPWHLSRKRSVDEC